MTAEAWSDSREIDRSEIHSGRSEAFSFLVQPDEVEASVGENHHDDREAQAGSGFEFRQHHG